MLHSAQKNTQRVFFFFGTNSDNDKLWNSHKIYVFYSRRKCFYILTRIE